MKNGTRLRAATGKLGCRVNFPVKQGCCGQPAINSGYIKEAIPGILIDRRTGG
ncbi:heterodisulfide reductase-related iron-sulfur binding cluster [Escherichia coli]